MNPFESGAVIDMNMGHNRATPAPIGADALRVAAQAALTALENLHEIDTETECITIDVRDEIEALRAALASAAQPPAGFVLVPIELAKRVQETMGEFLMDHGWRQQDMDTSDEFDAALAAAAPASAAKEQA